MESLDTAARFMEDLLDFAEEELGEADDDFEKTKNSSPSSSSFSLLPHPNPFRVTPQEMVEEELEWISNKDAFPMVESFVDIIPNHRRISTTADHHSPVSVLDNSCGSSTVSHGSSSSHRGSAIVTLPSNLRVPVKARTKQQRKRRRDMFGEQWHSWAASSSSSQGKPNKKPSNRSSCKSSSIIGRKCLHCQAEKTPQWRAGPYGPKTLCNACGVRYKSGRLVPEYRPASSPTFSSALHSNSHRKIVEMRKQKMGAMDSGSEAKPKPKPKPRPKEEIG